MPVTTPANFGLLPLECVEAPLTTLTTIHSIGRDDPSLSQNTEAEGFPEQNSSLYSIATSVLSLASGSLYKKQETSGSILQQFRGDLSSHFSLGYLLITT